MVSLPSRYPLDPPRRPIPSGSSHVARDGAKSNTVGDLGPAGAARRGGPRDAGACGVLANVLFLRPGTREHFLENLARDWPEELERYEELYAGRAYLPGDETKPVRARVAGLAKEIGIADRRRVKLAPPAEPEQLALAV